MEKRNLEALRGSIDKWKQNTIANSPDDVKLGWKDCPLCVIYNNYDNQKSQTMDWYETRCIGCPVHAKTGAKGCRNTPYHDVEDVHTAWQDVHGLAGEAAARENFRSAALDELLFLESLLPGNKE